MSTVQVIFYFNVYTSIKIWAGSVALVSFFGNEIMQKNEKWK